MSQLPSHDKRGEVPPNRLVDLAGYIRWYMDEEGKRTFNDPSTMGLVLRMDEWRKIASALSHVAPMQCKARGVPCETPGACGTDGCCHHSGEAVHAPSTTRQSRFDPAEVVEELDRLLEGWGNNQIYMHAREVVYKARSVISYPPSATPLNVLDAAKKALRTYVWKVQHPAAPIAGYASFDGAMVELRDALLAAGEEQGFENNSPDGGKQTP